MTQATILIVDDHPANLAVLFEALTGQGYRVLVNTSGEATLTTVNQNPPDLILLDVMMPGIDGFETCRRLKASPAGQTIPLIFMTALTDPIDEVKGLELGAIDYITKPIQVQTVLARVKTHLTLYRLQKELTQKNIELQEALNNIKTLKGLIPICANCKKIRDDEGFWQQLELYITTHSEAEFSHGICPDCARKLYPSLYP